VARVTVPLRRLAVRDTAAHRMVVEPGSVLLDVARHAADPTPQRLSVTLAPADVAGAG
jgi:hypothetical protein